MQASNQSLDAHEQLRNLYRILLDHEDRYHEFKQLLSAYPGAIAEETHASLEARARLNTRIQEWLGHPFEGLNAMQVALWRGILIEERYNVALAPWKESNWY